MSSQTDDTANSVNNLREIVLGDFPMIDVRAPVEFDKGTILNAVSQPLMDNEQRHVVGSCYKKNGQQDAIRLGNKLVSGAIKAQRIDDWCRFYDQNPNTHIFCSRGGLRSKTSQQWIQQTGRDIPLIQGGYKALRQFLIEQTQIIVEQLPSLVIGGQTGCGKTELLDQMRNIVDLEGMANHRGSAFGKQITPQPSQINFENQLAKRLLQLQQLNVGQLILEDESRTIGRCALPEILRLKMQQAPVYVIQDSHDNRVGRILNDYVINMARRYCAQLGPEQGFTQFSEYLTNAFNGIKRRLGDNRHKALLIILNDALLQQQSQNDPNGHRQWISILLEQYYDPIYQYQLNKKHQRIVFSGNSQEVLEALTAQQQG